MKSQPAASRNRLAWACGVVAEMARRAGPNAKLPTVRQIASRIGISTGTVYRVLERLERGQIIVRRHGRGIYGAPRVGRKSIAAVLHMDPYRPRCTSMPRQAVAELRQLAGAAGCDIQFYVDPPSHSHPSAARRHLEEDIALGLVHGVLLYDICGPAEAGWARQQGVPAVFGNLVDPAGAWQVCLDYEELVRLGTRSLIDRGCRRIGLFDLALPPQMQSQGDARLAAFRSTLASAGRPFEPRWFRLIPLPAWDDWLSAPPIEELAFEQALQLWSSSRSASPGLPDAVVVTDDVVAFGVLTALERLGIRIGADLAVAAHVNRGSNLLMSWSPRLLRLEFDLSQFNRATIQMLAALMDGRKPSRRVHWIKPVLREPEVRLIAGSVPDTEGPKEPPVVLLKAPSSTRASTAKPRRKGIGCPA